ncbi:MAG: DnaA regulatory inactivator Hda [Gammaproteobacteria bacterium]|nr:DnaA regulatory inactivator Hda [Gammaproteobacteria bacterium]
MNRQLALRVGLSDLASFDNFHAGSNSEAVAAVRDLAAGRAGILYLHGGPGTGKSHLLYAAVKEAGRRGRSAIYASRAAVESQDGDWLDLPGSGLVCIDDIAEVLGEPEARALFALYERIRSHSGSLVLSARHSPESGHWVLPDLRSRVRSDLVYRLAALADRDLEQALRLRAGHRGIVLGDDVVRYVLSRYERSPAPLFRLLDRIDAESLARKRRVTVPFLKALESDGEDSAH